MDNYNENFYKKTEKGSAGAPKDVKVSLSQQVKSINFKMADKKKKSLRFIHSEGSTDTNSVTSVPDDHERSLSDVNNEDDQMTVVEQIVHENAEKEGASATDAAERADQPKLESDPWTFSFDKKIGEIKTRDDEPLHVFK